LLKIQIGYLFDLFEIGSEVQAPAFLKAMQNAGQQKARESGIQQLIWPFMAFLCLQMEMQKLFTKKTSKKGPVEELKEQLILIVKGVLTALSPTHFVAGFL